MGKEGQKSREGIWVGAKMRSDEALVGTENGLVKARSIWRLPKTQRWDSEMIAKIRAAPRKPNPAKNSDHIPCDTNSALPPRDGEDDTVLAIAKEGPRQFEYCNVLFCPLSCPLSSVPVPMSSVLCPVLSHGICPVPYGSKRTKSTSLNGLGAEL